MAPSPLGHWRLLRHYLTHANVPGFPEQWENLLRRIEKTVTSKLQARPVAEELKAQVLRADSVRHEPHSPVEKPAAANKTSAATSNTSAATSNTSAATNNTSAAANNASAAAIVMRKEMDESPPVRLNKEEPPAPSSSSEVTEEKAGLTLSGLLAGMRLSGNLARGQIDQQTTPATHTVSKSSVHARTSYVISALVAAHSSDSLKRRADNLIQHLVQYPEARDYAVKEGGVRALLRVQNRLDTREEDEKEVDGLVREALSLLGYLGPPRGPGPNILSLDGGGVRGLIAIEILRQLERLSGRKVNELFDYIVGVSTGAIIAAVIGSNAGSLDTAADMYHTLSKQMFGQTSLIGGASRLVLTHSYYDSEAWEKMLQASYGDIQLMHCSRRNAPKMALVSCVVNTSLSPFLFRSYEMPFRVRSVFPGTTRARVWEAVRASAAAPTYFTEFKHDGLIHQDGGIMVNNPAGIALHEARLLYGGAALERACLVSIGTGRLLPKPTTEQGNTSGTSWKDKFNKILDSATDTEGVHLVLSDLLADGCYFRLNPPLNAAVAMDEIDSAKLNSLLDDTRAYMRRNRHKLQQAAAMLTRRRSLTQRLADTLQHQALLLGVKQQY